MNPPVFITARFRTGSTMLWNLYHQLPECRSFYEPLHDALTSYIKYPIKPQKSHFFIETYFDEYKINSLPLSFHSPDFANQRIYLESQDYYPELETYIRTLVESVPSLQTPVLQFNRIDFRLPWIRKNFPEARILHLTRNPREQWYSNLAAFNVDIDQNIDLDAYSLVTWARDLYKHQFPFLATPQIEHAYQRFYYLWKLSYLAGKRLSDLSIAYEDILAEPREQLTGLLNFSNLYSEKNLETWLTFVQSKPEREWKKDKDDSWFEGLEQKCEAVLDELGLNDHFSLKPLSEIQSDSYKYQELLNDQENDRWFAVNLKRAIVLERNYSYELVCYVDNNYKNALIEKDKIQNERDELQMDLNGVRLDMQGLRQDLERLRSEWDRTRDDLNESRLDVQRLRADFSILHAERDRLQVEYDKVLSVLENLEGDRDQLQAKYTALEGDRDQLQAKYTALEGDRDQLQATYTALESDRDQLQAKYAALESDRYRLQTKHEDARTDLATLHLEKDRLQDMINEAKMALDHIQVERDQILAELDHVYHSRSYRITAPMRAVFGTARVWKSRLWKPKELPTLLPGPDQVEKNDFDIKPSVPVYLQLGDQNISLDDVMERIRAEITARNSPFQGQGIVTQPALASELVSIKQEETRSFQWIKSTQLSLQGSPLYQPIYRVARKFKKYIPKYQVQGISIEHLLRFEDEDFIRNAYRAILRREPDGEGFNHYLSLLRKGSASKIAILGRLRYSKEGRQMGVKVEGLTVRSVFQK